ncbi:MAG: ketoacyl-ACP synthase III [Chitinophagales bacterium]|nr:ketoacyl-ACP synthase III [Chitinophagales bacterium]
MAFSTVHNIFIEALAAAVPAHTEDNLELQLLSEKERELFVKTVGIRYRKVAQKNITASDLCLACAEDLFSKKVVNRSEIKVLIFITQTPDYLIPNTASILQHKLGLQKDCIAFDVNLGCSGFVYGLNLAASLLANITEGKALLLVGDVSTAVISKRDKSVVPLFSDAGSATVLARKTNKIMQFNLQTDGAEYDDIIISDGGMRNKISGNSLQEIETGKSNFRAPIHMKLDGIRIFNFALREVAPNIKALCEAAKKTQDEIDFFVLHQANRLMLESVRKKLGVEETKVPYSLYDFGNTSSASIPLTMVTNLRYDLMNRKLKLLLSGFGVGLSWGSVLLETENIFVSPLIEMA